MPDYSEYLREELLERGGQGDLRNTLRSRPPTSLSDSNRPTRSMGGVAPLMNSKRPTRSLEGVAFKRL